MMTELLNNPWFRWTACTVLVVLGLWLVNRVIPVDDNRPRCLKPQRRQKS